MSGAPSLSPNLRLERKLGQGAMGEVWHARSLSLDAPVAVKILQRVSSASLRMRFEQEARQAARISSPPPAAKRCWVFNAMPQRGFSAQLAKCDQEFTASYPRCSVPRVLERAYRKDVPARADIFYAGNNVGRHEWHVDDANGDRHTITDDC